MKNSTFIKNSLDFSTYYYGRSVPRETLGDHCIIGQRVCRRRCLCRASFSYTQCHIGVHMILQSSGEGFMWWGQASGSGGRSSP